MSRAAESPLSSTEQWRSRVVGRIRHGDRFVGLYGITRGESCQLTALVATNHSYDALDVTLHPTTAGTLEYPSLSPDIRSAFWHERALHDLSGVIPVGHPRLDPLLLDVEEGSDRPQPGAGADGDGVRQRETPHGPVDVAGRGMFTLAFGPVRSGVFESIEFLIESPGEDIPHLNIRPHFKHRGVAKKFEDKTAADGVLVAERVEGIASVAHALAFSHAIEQIADVRPPSRARLIRVVLAELERVANHLDVAMRLADAAGLAVATARFAWHKETTMRLTSRLCGSRFGRGMVIPGGVSADFQISPERAVAEISALHGRITADAKLAMHTPSFLDRLRGTGRLDTEYASQWGLVGPLARASGGEDDLRWSRPKDAYPDLPLPSAPARETDGDVMARLRVRWSEIDTSLGIAAVALGRLATERSKALAVAVEATGGSGFGIGAAEGPQGEMVHAVTMKDGQIQRCYARSASLHNLVAFHDAFPNDVFTDFAFIEASFGLGYAGVAM
jgi:Ni,Fe-hydrogenase III large subunit